MIKIAVAAILVVLGLVIMSKARGAAALMGFVMLIVGLVGSVALYMDASGPRLTTGQLISGG